MFRAVLPAFLRRHFRLRYLEKLATIIRFPGERHDLSRSGKAAHRVERVQRQAPAMRLVSTVIVLVLTSALHQPTSPWHQDAKVISSWDATIVRGEFGAAPLSSEIGLTRDAGCRAPRPIGRAPTPDPQHPPDLLSAQLRAVPRCRRQTDPKTDALLRAYADVPGPGVSNDYLRPAARYAIKNAERALRELRPSHNSEFDRLHHRATLRPKRGWNRAANWKIFFQLHPNCTLICGGVEVRCP
jgi:hypothetical protein